MARLKAPWDWCPGTRTDANGNTCKLFDTHIDLFLLFYIKYTCTYKCPGLAGIEIQESYTKNRALLVIDWDDD